MIKVFSSHQKLKACGINKQTWSGLGKKSHDLDHTTFLLFQKELFARWNDFATGRYWSTVLPEIHVYSYGVNQAISYDDPDSLDVITEDLNRQYDLSSISTLSFAIATQVSLTQVDHSGSHSRALLASMEQIWNQYNSQKVSRSHLRTFRILLSPKSCNFQSETLSEFYRNAIRSIIKKVEDDNEKVDSIVPPLDFVSFQGYSFFQKQVHSDFLLGQINYAGAHCISKDHLQGVNLNKLHKLRENTAVHRPIAIVNEGLTVLGSGDPIPFRFEPVITISLHSLNEDNRTFEYIVDEIIKPLLDLWHENHIYTQILLPFDISVIISLSMTYKQTFLGVARDFTKLFQTLLQGIIEREMPSQDDIQYLIYMESISILERLIIWILTGDESIQPIHLYKALGLLNNALCHGWPGIDQDILDLDTFQIKLTNWPMNGDQRYFSQIPALKKHYDMHTANTQQIILSCLVLPSKNTNTSAGYMEALRHIFKHFFIPVRYRFRGQPSGFCGREILVILFHS